MAGASANYGCSKCTEKADTVDNRKHYLQNNTDAPLRTKESTIFFGQLAATYPSFSSVCGVKGLSVLGALTKFDFVRDCVIDSLHHLYLHVVKDVFELWFSDEYQVCT